MKLEDLVKFLADNGVETPEGATADQVIALISTLLGIDGGGEGEGEGDKETPAPNPESNSLA